MHMEKIDSEVPPVHMFRKHLHAHGENYFGLPTNVANKETPPCTWRKYQHLAIKFKEVTIFSRYHYFVLSQYTKVDHLEFHTKWDGASYDVGHALSHQVGQLFTASALFTIN